MIIAEMTDDEKKAWEKWLRSRPPIIKELANRFPPNRLYRLKEPGHRVTIRSYCEDGTMTVNVTGKYNLIMFDRNVFGIKPDDLEECDLPKSDERLGTVLTKEEDIQRFIQLERKRLGYS
jgi:hypothetical protein